MHIFPVRIHGMLDYIVGVLLVLAPWLFGLLTTVQRNGCPSRSAPRLSSTAC